MSAKEKHELLDIEVEPQNGWTEVLGFSQQCQLMQRSCNLVKIYLEKELETRAYKVQDNLLIRGLHEKYTVIQALRKFCNEFVACKYCYSARTGYVEGAAELTGTVTCFQCSGVWKLQGNVRKLQGNFVFTTAPEQSTAFKPLPDKYGLAQPTLNHTSFDERNPQQKPMSAITGSSNASTPWMPLLPINKHAEISSIIAEAVGTPLATAQIPIPIREREQDYFIEDVEAQRLPLSIPALKRKVPVATIAEVPGPDSQTGLFKKEGQNSTHTNEAAFGEAFEEVPITVPTHVPAAARSPSLANPRTFATHLWKIAPSFRLKKFRSSSKPAASDKVKLLA